MGNVVSVHLGEPGLADAAKLHWGWRGPDGIEGMLWGEVGTVVDFTTRPGPSIPRPSRIALVASWDADESIDRFVDAVPAARRFDWHLRIEPIRAVGTWPSLEDVPRRDEVSEDDDPVAVTTLAYTRPSQFPRFVRTSRPAERAAAGSADVDIAIGIARPPRFVATFSLWRSVAGMRAFAHPRGSGPHTEAIAENRRKGFHDDEIFLRGRPYGEDGEWRHRRGPRATQQVR